jgi:hypothetical protein
MEVGGSSETSAPMYEATLQAAVSFMIQLLLTAPPGWLRCRYSFLVCTIQTVLQLSITKNLTVNSVL